MRKYFIITLLVSATHFSFAQKAETLQWIVGTWKINVGSAQIIENWKQINDSTFSGKSIFVKAPNDTTLQETLQLVNKKGEWYYVSTVVGQNDNQPVAFRLIFIGRSEFVSSNTLHDFPQRIAYRRIGKQLSASIEGNRKGRYDKRNFDFVGD